MSVVAGGQSELRVRGSVVAMMNHLQDTNVPADTAAEQTVYAFSRPSSAAVLQD